MKAVAVVEGGALSYGDYPDPVAGPGEVVVELRAAAINRRDLLLRNPPGPAYVFDLPVIPGSDGAGIRRDTGEEVVIYPGLQWGSRQDAAGPDWRILGGPDDGTYAELVKLPEENVFPKPARLSWEESAAFPLAALTAYRGLFEVGGLVGGVFDSVGTTWRESLRALRRGGRLVVFGGTGGPEVTLDIRALYLNWQSIHGTTMGSRQDFAALMRMVEAGTWRPVIDSVRPLAEAEAAHDRMKAGEHFGKLVLSI